MGIREAASVLADNVKDLAKSPKKYVSERTLPAYGEALSSGAVGKAVAEIKDRKSKLDEKIDGYKRGGAVKAKPAPAKKSTGFNW